MPRGKARTIQVEVRKKRTFVKRDEAPAADEPSRRRPRRWSTKPNSRAARKRPAAGRAAAPPGRRAGREAPPARRTGAARPRGRRGARAPRPQRPRPPARRRPRHARRHKAEGRRRAAASAVAAPAEPAKPALRVVKAADVEAAEKQRADRSGTRRKAAETEAAAIRAMMTAPKKVLLAKKPEEAAAGGRSKAGIKGTIHKPARRAGRARGAGRRQAGRQEVGQVREAVVELGRRRGQEARAEDPRRHRRRSRPGWRAPARPRPRRPQRRPMARPSSPPAEAVSQEVHVPETITRGRSGAQDVGQGLRGHQAADEARPDGHHQPAARPGDGDDRGRGDGPQGAVAAKLDDPEAFPEEEEAAPGRPSSCRARRSSP